MGRHCSLDCAEYSESGGICNGALWLQQLETQKCAYTFCHQGEMGPVKMPGSEETAKRAETHAWHAGAMGLIPSSMALQLIVNTIGYDSQIPPKNLEKNLNRGTFYWVTLRLAYYISRTFPWKWAYLWEWDTDSFNWLAICVVLHLSRTKCGLYSKGPWGSQAGGMRAEHRSGGKDASINP